MADNSTGINLVNLTVKNTARGQAEGLFLDGVPLPGAKTATLKLERVRAGDAGSYTMTATNASGSATSRPAALSVR